MLTLTHSHFALLHLRNCAGLVAAAACRRRQVNENVRGKDVYLVQPTCPPGVNDQLMELLLMVSTMRRASTMKITAVIPY